MMANEGQRPLLRLAIALPVLLVCSVCAVAAVRGGNRQIELMSGIDEYLEGKYGTGEAQSLGQLNKFDHTGYAGTQSVAKEFGLSNNNPLVQKWNEDSTTDSLNETPASIVRTVFGEPQPARAPASAHLDAREAAMRVAGATAVNSVSLAAQRNAMREEMQQKFEAQAESSTQRWLHLLPTPLAMGPCQVTAHIWLCLLLLPLFRLLQRHIKL